MDMSKLRSSFIRFLSQYRALALLAFIAVLACIMSVIYPTTFLTAENFRVILLNMSAEGIVLVAITLVLIMGEVDLSIGANMVLGGILCGRFMILNHLPTWLAILIPLIISLFIGTINGYIVAKLKVISFIGTMATSMIYMGIAILLAGAGWTDFPDKTFRLMGQAKLFGFLQMPIIYAVIIIAIFAYCLAKTRYFRQLYFIGGNTKAALLSGINIDRTKMVIFVMAAFLGCMAGIITAMRFNAAQPSIGAGVELRAITAAVIGGVSFSGGTGNMAGAAMGALFIAFLNNSLTMLKVSPDLQYVVTGVILVLAIVFDNVISKESK